MSTKTNNKFNKIKLACCILGAAIMFFAVCFSSLVFSGNFGDIKNLFVSAQEKATTYEIGDEASLKAWLKNDGNVKTVNKSATLTNDITLNWAGPAPDNTNINSGESLNGLDHTVNIKGFSGNFGSSQAFDGFGFFAKSCNGQILNTSFTYLENISLNTQAPTMNNTNLFMGTFASASGLISKCSVTLSANMTFTTDYALSRKGNHLGLIAGKLEGAGHIFNCRAIQNASSTVSISASTGASYSNFFRYALVVADAYNSGGHNPSIRNIYVERFGHVNFSGISSGNACFGAILGDIQLSGDGSNHAVSISGVIYKGVADPNTNVSSNANIGYLIGRDEDIGYTFIENFYSQTVLSNAGELAEIRCGVSLTPTDCFLEFDKDSDNKMVLTKTGASPTDFIWNVQHKKQDTILKEENTYSEKSSRVKVSAFNSAKSDMNQLTVVMGRILQTSIDFGFDKPTTNPIYNGTAFKNYKLTIEGRVLSSLCPVIFSNNINASTPTLDASCRLELDAVQNGAFLETEKVFVPADKINYINNHITIEKKALTLSFAGSHIYDNLLTITGLVPSEAIAVDGRLLDNGTFSFATAGEKTLANSNLGANPSGTLLSNYSITFSGNIKDAAFIIAPFMVPCDTNLLVSSSPQEARIANGQLEILDNRITTITLKNPLLQNKNCVVVASMQPGNESKLKYETLQSEATDPILGKFQEISLTTESPTDFMFLTSIKRNVSNEKILINIDLLQFENDALIEKVILKQGNEIVPLFSMGTGFFAALTKGENYSIEIILSDEIVADKYKTTFFLNNSTTSTPNSFKNGLNFTAQEVFDNHSYDFCAMLLKIVVDKI
ncbi:MAG: hypothetical protein RR400_01460 [Clostridia bacterium]